VWSASECNRPLPGLANRRICPGEPCWFRSGVGHCLQLIPPDPINAVEPPSVLSRPPHDQCLPAPLTSTLNAPYVLADEWEAVKLGISGPITDMWWLLLVNIQSADPASVHSGEPLRRRDHIPQRRHMGVSSRSWRCQLKTCNCLTPSKRLLSAFLSALAPEECGATTSWNGVRVTSEAYTPDAYKLP
jgi:hypothetical protein